MTTRTTKYKMLPYLRGADIDFDSLEFKPDVKELPPDHMEQRREIDHVINLLTAHFTDFDRRPDIFLDRESFICYNPDNLNVRVSPDVYAAFGVDAEAIRPRRIYLPWEAQKPPDWVLEVASASTSRTDVARKPAIYAQIGVPEYWRFDPSGGNYYGTPLAGGSLVESSYQPIEITGGPGGVLMGYSEVLQLYLCWDEGWPRFYDPATGTFLDDWESDRAARFAAEAQRDAASAENRRLREELHRLRGES